MKKFLLSILALVPMMMLADEAYRDNQVRFTVIDEGTIRLEYAPDGKFVDNKSFVAVERQYADVPRFVKLSNKQVVIETSKFRLTYKRGTGAFTPENLSITSVKGAKVPFRWTPGVQQKENLKGTAKTLDGYDGTKQRQYSGRPDLELEEGLLAKDGWTLIDDSKSYLFDGSEDWDWVTERQSAEGAQDWYFMAYGHDYKAALKSFTKFAGRVPMPPRYTFGYWWSRYWSYSDQDFRDLITTFEENDIPLDVLVIDMDWHPISEAAGGGWTGWDWNERLFPDYKKFLNFLDEHGVKTTMNLHPADGVRPFEKKYEEFRQRIGMKEGEVREWLGSDKQYVKALFETYLHPYIKEGVDFWWLDWQQWSKDKKFKDLDNVFWCNYIWFTDMERMGGKRPLLYHRWGGLGNHRYQIGFSGDSYITWESLKFLPYFNSTASNVLYGYWSHDIGGHQSLRYNTPVPAELYTRSMQMGAYLPIIRTHSTKDPSLNKEPWAFDQKTQQRLKAVVKGRYALVPYIYTMARETYENGISLCRPMYYDFPEAKEAYEFRNQYMFGSDMMIAPITQAVDEKSGLASIKVWLPEGEWVEYETGALLKGGQVVERAFTIDEYPVYIKAGAILPYYGKVKNLEGNDSPIIVRVFPGLKEGKFSMYEDNGEDCEYAKEFATTELSYQREGKNLTVKIAPRKGSYKNISGTRPYSVALPCQKAPESVKVDGKDVKFEYDGMNLETTIDLGRIDCSKGAEVSITFAEEDNTLADGMKAKLHRIRQAVADFKQKDCGMVYTENFGYLEATPLRLTYHPELQEETLKRFNELYASMPLVLMQQMSEENAKQFMASIDFPAENAIEDVTTTLFKNKDGKPGFDLTFLNGEWMKGDVVANVQWEVLKMNTNGAPVPEVGDNEFSIIATSSVEVSEAQDVFMQLSGDDGYRMFIDGKLVMEDWGEHAATSRTHMQHFEPGHKYEVKIEYFDHAYGAVLELKAVKLKK